MSLPKSLAHIEITEALKLFLKSNVREHNGCLL
jgi:hypothetical protein